MPLLSKKCLFQRSLPHVKVVQESAGHPTLYILYTVDIEGLVGFIFRRVHNEFRLGLFSIAYLVLQYLLYIYIFTLGTHTYLHSIHTPI